MQGVVLGVLFLWISIVMYLTGVQNSAISFALGVMVCVAVILLMTDYEVKTGKTMSFFAKYTMPIFLLHTLFAAPLRSILLKMGVINVAVHVVLGLEISFAGPIVTAWIMKKTNWLEFFLYPTALKRK